MYMQFTSIREPENKYIREGVHFIVMTFVQPVKLVLQKDLVLVTPNDTFAINSVLKCN